VICIRSLRLTARVCEFASVLPCLRELDSCMLAAALPQTRSLAPDTQFSGGQSVETDEMQSLHANIVAASTNAVISN
jgi:hypothetical protein